MRWPSSSVTAPEATRHNRGMALDLFSESDVAAWRDARPELAGDLGADAEPAAAFFRRGADLIARLPERPARSEAEQAAAAEVMAAPDEPRDRFLPRHTRALYAELTANGTQAVRAEDLVYRAADRV